MPTPERIYQKTCPECYTLNISDDDIQDRSYGYATIVFKCKHCNKVYKHWYYGYWEEIAVEPFNALCMSKALGLTPKGIYKALPCGDDTKLVIIENDDELRMVEYSRDLFIINEGGKSGIKTKSTA